MTIKLTSSGIEFPDAITQYDAAKKYTQIRYVNTGNVGATSVSITNIPTEARTIVIASKLGFSSGPNTPIIELYNGSTIAQGYYYSYLNINYNYMGSISGSRVSNANPFSNLITTPSYSEAPTSIVELTRTGGRSTVDYVFTYYVNTRSTSVGNHVIGNGVINTSSMPGIDKILIRNGSSNNLYDVDINVYYI